MTYLDSLNWKRIFDWRRECFERFGAINDLEVVRSPFQELTRYLSDVRSILDIGAGVDESLRSHLPESVRYYSLDVDREGDFDFHDFTEIPADFAVSHVWSSQTLEHLAIPEAWDLLNSAYKVLEPSGHMLVTVPNAAHPVRQRADITHVTAWPYNELYGFFREAGFSVERIVRYNKFRYPVNPLRRFVVSTVCDVFRIDWCDSIMLVAQKPSC